MPLSSLSLYCPPAPHSPMAARCLINRQALMWQVWIWQTLPMRT
ncbi:hypothetical protein [Moraxella lacunata]